MPQQNPGSAGRYGAPPPDGEQWGEDDEWGTGGRPQHGPVPPPLLPGYRSGGRTPRIQPVTAAVIAVIALAAAVMVALILTTGSSPAPPASAAPGNAPVGGAPVQGGGGGGSGAFGGGGAGQMFIGGKVTKISSTSITLGAQGHVITAAITSSTQFTGSVKSASGIKAGDAVTASITGYDSSRPVANSISDPAQMP